MHDPASPARHVRFGAFDLDVRSGELRKGPTRLKVPDQSIEILKALVEQPGELITREQLRERLWPSDTFVDFEHGLNAAVRRLRDALGDSADAPHYIETLPRRGYRFIGAVDPAPSASFTNHSDPAAPQLPSAVAPKLLQRKAWRQRSVVAISVACALLVAGGTFLALRPRIDPPGPPLVSESTRLTFDTGYQTEPTFSPDGRSIAYTSDKSGNFDIWQRPVAGGNQIQVTSNAAQDWQPDWSPDGNAIAFRSERDGGGIFVVPTTGGYEQPISNSGYRPRWSPDGSRILFRSRFDGLGALNLVGRNGGPSRQLVTAEAYSEKSLFWGDLDGAVAWHPDGRLSLLSQLNGVVRLTMVNPDDGTTNRFSATAAVQQKFRELGLSIPGGDNMYWAPDITALYFVGITKNVRSPWMVTVDPATLTITGGPHRLTTNTGPNKDMCVSRDGLRIAFAAPTPNVRVWLYALDSSGKRIEGDRQPVTPAGILAVTAELSRDGTKLLYMMPRPGSRDRSELRERVIPDRSDRPLLFHDLARGESRFSPRWSPDGRLIAYRYIAPGFGPSPENPRGADACIKIFDTRSGKESQLTSPFPQKVGLWAETAQGWSADGRFVVSTSSRYKPDQFTIALVPLSAAPRAENAAQIVTSSAEYGLWNANMSANGRWICFNATRDSTSRLAVVSSKGGGWVWITDGTNWIDKPRWSADGRFLYFMSQEGGLGDVWGVEFDPIAGRSIGRPFRLTHFTGPGERVGNVTQLEIGVSRGRLAIPLLRPTGGIWMLEHFKR